MKKFWKLIPFIIFSIWFTYITLFIPLSDSILIVSTIVVCGTIIYGGIYYFWVYSAEIVRGRVRIRRKSLKDFEVLNRVLKLINEEHSFEEVLQCIMDEAFHVIPGAESSSLLIYNQKRGVYEFRTVRSVVPEYFEDLYLTIEEVEAKFQNRKGPFIDNQVTYSDKCYSKEIRDKFKSYGIPAAILYIPIWVDGHLKGYITLDSWEDCKAFNRWDLLKIEQILPQLELAFNKAQKIAQIADYKYKLQQLYQIGQELAVINNSDGLFRKILKSIYKILQYDNAYIFLLDKDKLVYKGGYVLTGESYDFNPIKIPDILVGQGVCGWVAQYGEPKIVSNVIEEPRYIKRFEHVNSELAVPIKVANEVIGVLNLESYRLNGFTDEDKELMLTIANQLGIALSNLKYQNDLKKALLQIITALAKSIETKDNVTGGHCERMEMYALEIGNYLNLGIERLENLRRAAILHDVGKIGVPAYILEKTERLTEEEFKIMQEHPTFGANI